MSTTGKRRLPAALRTGRRGNMMCNVRLLLTDTSVRASTPYVRSTYAAVKLLKDLARADREQMVVLHLSASLQLLGRELVAMGSMNACHATPAAILKGLLLSNADTFVIAHNHPDDAEVKPSKADVRFTRDLVGACTLVGPTLLDHIILSGNKYYSFRRHYPEFKTWISTTWELRRCPSR